MFMTPNTIAVSDIHQSFPVVMERLSVTPLLMIKEAAPAAWLVSTEEWDRLYKMQEYIYDLEEVIELQKLEIDRLKADLPESVPADISKLETMAQRVPA